MNIYILFKIEQKTKVFINTTTVYDNTGCPGKH